MHNNLDNTVFHRKCQFAYKSDGTDAYGNPKRKYLSKKASIYIKSYGTKDEKSGNVIVKKKIDLCDYIGKDFKMTTIQLGEGGDNDIYLTI